MRQTELQGTGERAVAAPARELTAVLFVDIVGATPLALSLGDRAWAGNLIVGALILGLTVGVAMFAVRKIFNVSREATVKGYERRLKQQRVTLDGHDARQRSAEDLFASVGDLQGERVLTRYGRVATEDQRDIKSRVSCVRTRAQALGPPLRSITASHTQGMTATVSTILSAAASRIFLPDPRSTSIDSMRPSALMPTVSTSEP